MDVEEGFNALYRAHHGAILRYATRRTDPDTARDVVAETFLIAWRRLAAVPADPSQVEPWLYAVARRVLANAERARRRSQRVAERVWHESHDEHVPDPVTAISERQRLAQALELLSEADREVLCLIGWEELDIARAALVMGCSRSAMAVRLHRARRRLDRALAVIDGVVPVSRADGVVPVSRADGIVPAGGAERPFLALERQVVSQESQ